MAWLVRSLVPLLLCAAAPFAGAQSTYPNRSVRMIVGFAPGTDPDVVARLLAQKLGEAWGGQSVVVDNRAGAGGVIAATEAARATPDGYTLMLGETGQLSIAPSTYSKLNYDPKKDFVPVSEVVTSSFVLMVNPAKMPAHDMKEFVEWGRQQKPLFLGTFGAGTPNHFGAYLLGTVVGVPMEPVHYRSTGDALSGLFGGDVAGVFASVGLAAPMVKAGKLAALGTSGEARTVAMPKVPTFREQGYPQLVFNSWYGVVAPSGTPAPVIARLEADVRKVMQMPDVRAKLEELGFSVTGTSAADLARVIASDTASWGKIVAATGFRAD